MFHPQGPTWRELIAQALSSTEHGYDLLAPKFAYTPFCTPDAILTPAMACLGAPGSVATGLDVCCGTGAAMRHLRRLCRERIMGIDFSRGMLDVAAHTLARAPGEATVHLVRGNVLAMPFVAAFDLAVCFGALGHILPRDQSAFVTAVAEILKPGGRFAFVTSPRPPWHSARYCRARGFNAAMRLRNWMLLPPFMMYYLTFALPEAVALLERHGFAVTVYPDVFEPPFRQMQLVVGTVDGVSKR